MGDAGIQREEAVKLMEEYLQGESLRKHCYATEAAMRVMAERLGYDPALFRKCEDIHVPLEEFSELSLKAMGKISDILGL